MTKLEEQIQMYSNAYYQGQELIPDSQFDALVNVLKEKQPDSILLNTVVGTDIEGATKKVKHKYIITGTLAKAKDEKAFAKWWNKNNLSDMIVETKEDGNSQELIYENGKLVQTISRGNGYEGEDTTVNVSKIPGVIDSIPNFTGGIRGEVTMKNSVFNKYFKGKSANPRNMAAGIIKRLDGSDCDKLTFIAYDVVDIKEEHDKTELDKLDFLSKSGFNIPNWWSGCQLEDIIELRNNLPNIIKENDRGMDGLVIKFNKVDKNDLKRLEPTTAIAFKPELDTAITIVKDIEWSMKGSYFSPVAILEPVELCGTTVSRASLSNINKMNEMGVYIGAQVSVVKRGEIIPKCEACLEPKKDAFEIPIICPVCNGKVVVNQSGLPECINEDCQRKTAHRFKKLFKILGIKGTGDAFIYKLEEENISVKDFINIIKSNDKSALNKYAGGINGEKIFSQMKIALKKEITVPQFLATFDVKLFDEKKLSLLGDKTLEDIFALKYEDVLEIKGFADTTARALISFIETYKSEINDLKNDFTISSKRVIINTQGESKRIVVFTGTGPLPRAKLTELAISKGWEVGDSVNKKTTLLVCADPNSGTTKIQSAKKNGTKVISYENFLTENC